MRNLIKLVIVSFVVIIGISAIAIRLRYSANGGSSQPQKDKLVVHEWGTFTSIAGKDGVSLEWRPLNGASDLPKFVHSMQGSNDGLRHANGKGLIGAVRMETP